MLPWQPNKEPGFGSERTEREIEINGWIELALLWFSVWHN